MLAHLAAKLPMLVPWWIVLGVCAGVATSLWARSWKVLGLLLLVVLLSVPVSMMILVIVK